jgi:isopentenyldiphosphate isomerase
MADNDEELFDIVNDDNEVIGQERRSMVHAKGLKHRAVYCFVFDGEGALILQQRSPKCAATCSWHTYLRTPGGHVFRISPQGMQGL